MSRLLFCVPEYPPQPGGSGTLFAALARLWAEAGGESVVYTTAPTRSAPDRRDVEGRVSIRRFRSHVLGRYPLRASLGGAISRVGPLRWRAATGFPYTATRGYRPFLRHHAAAVDGPFALVIGGVLPHNHFLEPTLRFARRHGLPSVVVPLLHVGLLGRHPAHHVLGPGAPVLLQAASRLAVLTEAEIEPLERLGVARRRIVVTGAAVAPPTRRGDRTAFARRHGIENRWILQAGGLSADKGTLDLLAAHGARQAGGATEHLVLMGRPEQEVRRAVSALPTAQASGVRLIDEPSDDDWHDALAGAALLVHPSRADSFGLIFLEAWQAGVPVIAARAGGPAYVIRDNQDGVLVAPGDRTALAAAITRLLTDPVLAARLVGAGSERVRTDLTWPQVFPRWEALFRETLAR